MINVNIALEDFGQGIVTIVCAMTAVAINDKLAQYLNSSIAAFLCYQSTSIIQVSVLSHIL